MRKKYFYGVSVNSETDIQKESQKRLSTRNKIQIEFQKPPAVTESQKNFYRNVALYVLLEKEKLYTS